MLRQQASTPSNGLSDSHDTDMQSIAQISVRLAGEFLVLQARATKLMLGDPMQRQQELARRLLQPFGEPQRAREMQAIARRWAELILLTQSAFIHAFFRFPYAIPASVIAPERRASAQIFRFPERRAAKL